ncbi:hypothetical protein BU15DRAFT_60016 [Melanogaster broomeanus]|nr:hypothetical protein BU15DRAFT_60016 [Melanogaster broomeanus]
MPQMTPANPRYPAECKRGSDAIQEKAEKHSQVPVNSRLSTKDEPCKRQVDYQWHISVDTWTQSKTCSSHRVIQQASRWQVLPTGIPKMILPLSIRLGSQVKFRAVSDKGGSKTYFQLEMMDRHPDATRWQAPEDTERLRSTPSPSHISNSHIQLQARFGPTLSVSGQDGLRITDVLDSGTDIGIPDSKSGGSTPAYSRPMQELTTGVDRMVVAIGWELGSI